MLQTLLCTLMHTLAKEMVQLFWMMWPVLAMRAGWWTASIPPFTTVHTVKMLELVASMNVSSVNIVTGFDECAMQVSSVKHCCSDLPNGGKGT